MGWAGHGTVRSQQGSITSSRWQGVTASSELLSLIEVVTERHHGTAIRVGQGAPDLGHPRREGPVVAGLPESVEVAPQCGSHEEAGDAPRGHLHHLGQHLMRGGGPYMGAQAQPPQPMQIGHGWTRRTEWCRGAVRNEGLLPAVPHNKNSR